MRSAEGLYSWAALFWCDVSTVFTGLAEHTPENLTESANVSYSPACLKDYTAQNASLLKTRYIHLRGKTV